MNAEPPKDGWSAEAGNSSQKSRLVQRWRRGVSSPAVDQVAEEVPVAMVYNGISHAVMLATPASLEAFGLGFSLSEGIVQNRREVYGIDVAAGKDGIEVQMTIAQERFFALKARRRNLTGRTGCGLCGTESLEQVRRPLPLLKTGPEFTAEAVHKALDSLPEEQLLQSTTGAVHAAAWATASDDVTHVEEDIGRHNALDKLIGKLVMDGIDCTAGFAIVTSRASYEMVQKAATAAIPMLVAVSAPTGLAIDLAEEAGLTLVGFARPGSHVVYAHSQRLIAPKVTK